jgi:hypothetical protein
MVPKYFHLSWMNVPSIELLRGSTTVLSADQIVAVSSNEKLERLVRD